MKDDLGLKLIVIAILLVFVFMGTVCISLKLDSMEQNAKDRYLSTVVAVDFTRDKVKELLKRQSWSDVTQLGIQVGLLRCETSDILERQAWDNQEFIKLQEDILFIEAQLQSIRNNQFIVWEAIKEQNDKIYDYVYSH